MNLFQEAQNISPADIIGEEYILYIEKEKYTLTFREKITYGVPGIGAGGCQYDLNGKIYTDIASLRGETLEVLGEQVILRRDEYGRRVLYCCKSIPTFDSADREWDSELREFLIADGEHVDLVVCRGGYKLARLTVYRELLKADEGLEPYLEKIGVWT